MPSGRFVPAALLAILAAAQPVSAGPPDKRPFPSTAVSYADLDLATRTGMAQLDRRLAEAVREVCGSFGRYTAGEVTAARRCRVRTLANLREQRAAALAAAREAVPLSGSY